MIKIAALLAGLGLFLSGVSNIYYVISDIIVSQQIEGAIGDATDGVDNQEDKGHTSSSFKESLL